MKTMKRMLTVILACLLYFFENNTGTRIVLACSLLLPFVPIIRRSLFGWDELVRRLRELTRTVQTFAGRRMIQGTCGRISLVIL